MAAWGTWMRRVLGAAFIAVPVLANVPAAAAAPRTLAAPSFVLISQGQTLGSFKRLVGLTMETQGKLYSYSTREGTIVVKSLLTSPQWQRVSLARGTGDVQDIRLWRQQVKTHRASARQDATLEVVSASGTVVMSWTLSRAWPIKFASSDLNTAPGAPTLTSVTLLAESISRTS
jgi:phage tail-like protein